MSDSEGENLWAFVREAGQASCAQDLASGFAEVCSTQGFDWFFYLKLDARTETRPGRWRTRAHNCPADWESRYIERDYALVDPLLLHASNRCHGFSWRDLEAQHAFTRQERRVVSERAAAGLCDGFSVPLYGPVGEMALVSFARSDEKPPSRQSADILALAAYHFHTRHESFDPAPSKAKAVSALTKREREILTWCSLGKSNGVIGDILGVKEASVKFHLTNTYAKLGVASRPQAIVVAIKEGLIKP